jgi:glycosyltransferase involved in cell wall biosynthesis
MKPSLVTVVLPVYDRGAMLADAVSCLEAQTYRPLEIIVVDDGSTDETPDVCDRLSRDMPELVKTLRRPNGGPGAAREAGRVVARGEFIQYLDSDDWIHPRKLEIQVEALRREPGADIAYCRTLEIRAGESRSGVVRGRTGEALSSIFPYFLSGRLWHTITPLYRRGFCDRLGPWSSLRQEEDLEYDARAGSLGARLAYCPETLAEHRHHEGVRAGGDSLKDPGRMKARVESHRLVYGHALAAGIGPDDPHMRFYARELFLLARQCGAAGLSEESRELFRLARGASGTNRAGGADFRAYRALAAVVGWRTAGRLSCTVDRFRARAGTSS